MPEGDGPSASTGGAQQSSSLSHLPWGMIPAFKPGETDINDYTRRLEFLAELWPTEHLAHLAPRAAMLCEGGAFKRLMRVEARKLKVNNLDGIKLLVSTLGGVWGKAKHEEKFERFERAIYTTVQRADETHESYLARHDFQFEELASLHVTLEEMRAYCLLRNSGLLMDEKKKIIMDSGGRLEYDKVVAALKLLGSRFFSELQTSGKSTTRTKTYETANVVEEEEPTVATTEEDTFFQDSWDDEALLTSEENEQDALVIQQFEDSLVDVLQNDPETAQCFYSYLEARKRITERNKNRGFWPVKGLGGKGKGKGKFNFSTKGMGKGRKPLAQRILESECRRCGQKGHWKAECPRRFDADPKPSTGTAFAGAVLATEMPDEDDDMILISKMDENIAPGSNGQSVFCFVTMHSSKGFSGIGDSDLGKTKNLLQRHAQRLTRSLKLSLIRTKSHDSPLTSKTEMPASVDSTGHQSTPREQEALFVHHGPCGIVDLGASQTVIGSSQVQQLLQELPTNIQKQIRKIECNTIFRFGNSSTVTCTFAYLIPLAQWFVKLCVVPSQTPFLISNNVFRKLGAVIDTEQAQIHFPKLALTMPLTLTDRNLFLLDFCSLVTKANQDRTNQTSVSLEKHAVLTALHCECSSADRNDPCLEKMTSLSEEQSVLHSTQVCTDPVVRSDVHLVDPSVGSSDSDPTDLREDPRHGTDHGGRHCPPIPAGHSCHNGSNREGGVHAHDHGTAGTPADHVRQGKEGTALQRSRPERSSLRGMVHFDIPELRQTSSPEVHQVCQAVYGGPRTSEPIDSGEEHCNPGNSIQVESGSATKCRPGSSREDSLVVARYDSQERSVGTAARGDCSSERSDHPNRRGLDTDCDSAPIPDRPDELRGRSSVEPGPSGLAQTLPIDRLQLCDALGLSLGLGSEQISSIDAEYHRDILLNQEIPFNSILSEMHQYWGNKYGVRDLAQQKKHLQKPGIDLLEVYCSSDSALTNSANKSGLVACRFGLRQGDLSAFVGRCALYDELWKKRPKHIWVSPKCGPWCTWSRLNMMKSQSLAQRILKDRRLENIHLRLCSALCGLQGWRGNTFHFHLEQPQGSELIYQHEMKPVLETTKRVLCDMCVAGTLRHPNSQELLRKRTQVWTTSDLMAARLEQLQCPGTHNHGLIAGSCWTLRHGRQSLSRYTENYTSLFARHLSRIIQCSLRVQETHDHEISDRYHAIHAAITADPDETPAPKRRRLSAKSPAETLYESLRKVDPRSLLEPLLSRFEELAPRVGKRVIVDGPAFEALQQVFPDMIIQAVDLCKGVDRRRIMPIEPGVSSFRWMFARDRSNQQFFSDEDWEEWTRLSHRQQIRNIGRPARIAVTIFATPKEHANPSESGTTGNSPMVDESSNQDMSEPDTRQPTGDNSDGLPSRDCSLQHGPMFRSLPSALQSQLKRMHVNLGHPNGEQFARALADHGWAPAVQQAVRDMACDTCHELSQPKIARPGHLREAREFNDLIQFDNCEWTDPNGKRYFFFHFLDTASNFHVAIPYTSKTTEALIHSFQNAWLSWAGPPKGLMFDSATEANSEGFARFLQELDIKSHVIPTDAHWQLGRVERHGAILQNMLGKMYVDKPFQTQPEFERALIQLCSAKNAMSRVKGYTPEILVLGKSRRLPGSITDDTEVGSNVTALQTESAQFREQLEIREAARRAFVRADNCSELRRALHGRSRPSRCIHSVGDWVMYWKNEKWQGPAKVLMIDSPSIMWLSHLTRLIRCAPEHVRVLSNKELGNLKAQGGHEDPDIRPGSGVFQYHQLTAIPREQESSTTQIWNSAGDQQGTTGNPSQPSAIDTSLDPNVASEMIDLPPVPTSVHSEVQPDAEPDLAPSTSTPMSGVAPASSIDPSTVPIPVDEDDELVTQEHTDDFWEEREHCVIRHHVKPRLQLFVPTSCLKCPCPIKELGTRITRGRYRDTNTFNIKDQWFNNVEAHRHRPEIWVGQTIFLKDRRVPPENHPVQAESEPVFHTTCGDDQSCLTIEIVLSAEELQQCCSKQYQDQVIFLASQAKRQKVEVKMQDLKGSELQEMIGAKAKEIDQWLATDTVRRIARNKIPEDQILRTRWVLTWKPLDPKDQASCGRSKKAKARLVILGFEDPAIETLERDAPTLGRDSRSLILQVLASAQWEVNSFDIKTAFLRGSRQDSRILGIEPPPEMKEKMKLREHEVCELLKSAYGLINAPILWYQELKGTLLSLGFQMSPLDPCVFVLPKQSRSNQPMKEVCGIHGIIGIHVDDGIRGGDQIFHFKLKQLEAKYPFGSHRKRDMIFTGLRIRQEANHEIFVDQRDYIQDIPSIQVPRERRADPKSPVTSHELQALRGLIGSLQYAASNTRPDLSCKLSLLQAKIPVATVQDLLDGNRVLHEAKRYADVTVRYRSIPIPQIRFVSFSDAAFATREKANSQKG